MFVRKKIKSDIIIPQTVIFTKGNLFFSLKGLPKLWLFNSSKSKTPIILKKNVDKLNLTEIGRTFSKIRSTEDYKVDSLMTLQEIVKKNEDPHSVAFIRFAGDSRKG